MAMIDNGEYGAKLLKHRGREFRLRPLEIGDVPELHRLDQLCFSQEQAFTEGYFVLLFFYDGAYGWALEKNEEVIAFILLTTERKTANIATLNVHPNQRRLGLAGLLIELAETEMQKESVTSISLQVDVNNEAAIQLYLKHGFKNIRTIKDYYVNSDAYLMQKTLLKTSD